MKFCDKEIQDHLLKGGKIKRNDDDVLIAEYPTWQEAVNSKEFNE